MKKHYVLALVMTALLLSSCSAQTQDGYHPDLVKSFSEARLPLLKQKATPQDFSLPVGGTGLSQNLASLKGKVVFLNFWATWCGPCRSEMPSMEALHQRFKDKGLEMIAVNCAENQSDVLAFMNSYKLSFPTLLDSDGRVSRAYGIQAIPTTYLIDRDGKIISRIVGSLDWNNPKIVEAFEMLLR